MNVPPYDEAKSREFAEGADALYAEAAKPVDNGGSIFAQRCAFDFYTGKLDWPTSRDVHLRELRQALGLTSPFQPLPPAPTRDHVCGGQTTQQGFTVTLPRLGAFPWWGGAWAWLSAEERASAAQQLLAAGDTICVIQVALDGRALYDEPNQFYSADKFPPLQQSLAQTVALVREAIELGFTAVWLFLDGDNGAYGFPVAVQQVQELAPLMDDLNGYICYVPGWDGVFYGYTPQQVADFATAARGAGALYVGLEHSTGHIPVGNAETDYNPHGLMTGYDLVLGEFNDGQFDDTVWQVLGRMIRPYHRPAEQPIDDDPNPPFYLGVVSARGAYCYRVFEYFIYGWVRGTAASDVQHAKAYFEARGAVNVC